MSQFSSELRKIAFEWPGAGKGVMLFRAYLFAVATVHEDDADAGVPNWFVGRYAAGFALASCDRIFDILQREGVP